MSKNLVIVESPAKAKTIEQFLGSEFEVKSSFGHVRDLPKKGLNVDIEHEFEPTYDISPDKAKVVAELKKAAKNKEVWLATDDDREGEAIAWHLCQALNLPTEKTKRIVFHEITEPAIMRAASAPRTIDLKLVDAQQARRIMDRLVGYELSPILWKKVKTGLSAGRVQSVAVRLIVEREQEIDNFKPEAKFKVTAVFAGKPDIAAELEKKLDSGDSAKQLLQQCQKATFTVASVEQKPGTRSPSAPFTTSTLQQEASLKLGFSVRQTMVLAQKLYENGHITYVRTDSTVMSTGALKSMHDYIAKSYGQNYLEPRQYQTKSKGAQEAHEAIRPTHINKTEAGADGGEQKLYNLIWRRALASQMAAAKIKRTTAVIDISTAPEKLLAKGEVLEFDGFYKVYGRTKEDQILPELKPGQKLDLKEMLAREDFTKPPARYTEAALVRKLEELGIGRPSTYAPTISTIQTREYVVKGDNETGEQREVALLRLKNGSITEEKQSENFGADKGKLKPTFLGKITNDFLSKHFATILDYGFTAKAEEAFDDVEAGKQKWQQIIKEFYGPFHKLVEQGEKVSRKESTQMRKIGVDPKSKKPVFARFGRFGPMLQMGDSEKEDEKPTFASLPEDTDIESVTLDQALKMFELPREVGQTEKGEPILANIGKWGPYVKVGETFVSIKPKDPFKITKSEALALYKAKLKKEAERIIKEFDGGLQVLNGRYGPYITDGKQNAPVPKDTDPKKITLEQAKKLLEEKAKK